MFSYQSQKSRGSRLCGCRTVEATDMMPGLDGTLPGVVPSGVLVIFFDLEKSPGSGG